MKKSMAIALALCVFGCSTANFAKTNARQENRTVASQGLPSCAAYCFLVKMKRHGIAWKNPSPKKVLVKGTASSAADAFEIMTKQCESLVEEENSSDQKYSTSATLHPNPDANPYMASDATMQNSCMGD